MANQSNPLVGYYALNHKALKDLLGDALYKGRQLKRVISMEGGEVRVVSQDDYNNWLNDTYNLINLAIDKGEAECFRGGRADSLDERLRRLSDLIPSVNSSET